MDLTVDPVSGISTITATILFKRTNYEKTMKI
jgi:hypothetical protein